MNRGKLIAYIILGSIPVVFVLFLLAMVNVLLMLAALIALLGALLLIKQKKPEIFAMLARPKEEQPVIGGGSTRDHAGPPSPPKSQVYMVLTGREDFGARRITVNKNTYYIGRAKDNDFVIDGDRISRRHLRIEYNSVENTCYAIDADSANGTFINGERMIAGQRYRLLQGDQLMIDDRAFVVEYAHY